MTGVVDERIATIPTSPRLSAIRISVIPSVMAKKPLLMIIPRIGQVMGLRARASGAPLRRSRLCATNAVAMRTQDAATGSTPWLITGLASRVPTD